MYACKSSCSSCLFLELSINNYLLIWWTPQFSLLHSILTLSSLTSLFSGHVHSDTCAAGKTTSEFPAWLTLWPGGHATLCYFCVSQDWPLEDDTAKTLLWPWQSSKHLSYETLNTGKQLPPDPVVQGGATCLLFIPFQNAQPSNSQWSKIKTPALGGLMQEDDEFEGSREQRERHKSFPKTTFIKIAKINIWEGWEGYISPLIRLRRAVSHAGKLQRPFTKVAKSSTKWGHEMPTAKFTSL